MEEFVYHSAHGWADGRRFLTTYVLLAIVGLVLTNFLLLNPHLVSRLWPTFDREKWRRPLGYVCLIEGVLFTLLATASCAIGVMNQR